jgi:hypothetical protein
VPGRRISWARVGGVTLFVVLAIFVLAGLRLRNARNDLTQAKSAMNSAKTAVLARHPDQADASLSKAASALRSAHGQAEGFPLGVLQPLPLIGSPGKAIKGTVNAGEHVVTAGRLLASAAADFPTGGKAGVNGHDLSALHNAAVSSEAPIAQASHELHLARASLNGPRSAMLPMISSAAKPVAKLVDDARHTLDGATRGLGLMADLTAPTTDARILLLSQDTLEARPTGGFIGSFGVLHFDHGTVSLERYESYEDLPPPNPELPAPPGLAPWLNAYWDLSNSNWWPDYPTSARIAADMFKRQGGGDVQGVVAITENILSDLLGVFGPIQVPGYARPVAQKGFEDRVVYEVELKQPPDNPRKKFIAELGHEVFNRLFSVPPDQLPKVADVFGKAATTGDVQAWFPDPKRQAAVDGTAWAGALPQSRHDFLMLVDSNMSASKANRDLARDVTYTVKQDDKGRLVAHLVARYTDNGTPSPVNPYYNGYLRVYAPLGSKLLSPTKDQLDEGEAYDATYQVFSVPLDVKPQSSQTIDFRYILPTWVASGENYSLMWQRQTGTPNDTLTADVNGKAALGSPATRTLLLKTSLGPSGLRGALHSRWFFRRLGF